MSLTNIVCEEFFLTGYENKKDDKQELIETLQRSYEHSIHFKLLQYSNIEIFPSITQWNPEKTLLRQVKEANIHILRDKIEIFIKKMSDKLLEDLSKLRLQYINLSYNTFEFTILPTYELYIDELDYLLETKMDIIHNDIMNEQEKELHILLGKCEQLNQDNNIFEIKRYKEMNINVHKEEIHVTAGKYEQLNQDNNKIGINLHKEENKLSISVGTNEQLNQENNTFDFKKSIEENKQLNQENNTFDFKKSIEENNTLEYKKYKEPNINIHKEEKHITDILEKIKKFIKYIWKIKGQFNTNKTKYQVNKLNIDDPLFTESSKIEPIIFLPKEVNISIIDSSKEESTLEQKYSPNMDVVLVLKQNNVSRINFQNTYENILKSKDRKQKLSGHYYNKFILDIHKGINSIFIYYLNDKDIIMKVYYDNMCNKKKKRILDHG